MLRRLAILALTVSVFFLTREGATEPLRVAENLRHENVLLPQFTPDRSRLAVTGYALVDDEGDFSIAVLYDDPQTEREVDYLEVYDRPGDLLLIMWIDRFEIFQAAVDRGLLNEEEPCVDGILVIITEGIPL